MSRPGAAGEFLKYYPLAGKRILKYLAAHQDRYVLPSDLRGQYNTVLRLSSVDQKLAAFVSIAECEIPLQVEPSDNLVTSIIDMYMLGSADLQKMYSPQSELYSGFDDECEGRRKVFPLKHNPAASNKVNVYVSEVWASLRTNYPHLARSFRLYGHVIDGVFNDQASAILLAAVGMSGSYRNPVELALWIFLNIPLAEELSKMFKALGQNGCDMGALFVEPKCLLGRGVAPCDLAKEAKYRCDKAAVDSSVAKIDAASLRQAIREVLVAEIDTGCIEFGDPDEDWQKRWLWFVNGAHSNILGRAEPQFAIKPPGMSRCHRRVYAEMCPINPILKWSGNVYVSTSEKLETGKGRALFACDSNCYIAFEHLLRPIEKVWRGVNVILDPGKGGTAGMVDKLRGMDHYGAYHLMLDYDDFNSQHSLVSQMAVIDIACELCCYPTHLREKLVNSYRRMLIHLGGEVVGTAKGTLMSGHRATTFCNSVLNRAYLLALHPEIRKVGAVHVGDDVYLRLQSCEQASALLADVKGKLRMNRSKQSFGLFTMEFLRMATTKFATRGYLMRSVGGIVAGNWVTEARMSPSEALNSMVDSCWTLRNRSRINTIHRLLMPSVARMTGIRKAKLESILSGETGVNEGPTCHISPWRRSADIVVKKKVVMEDWSQYRACAGATKDYLRTCVQPVELLAMTLIRTGVENAMVEASFKKSTLSLGQGALTSELIITGYHFDTLGMPESASEVLGREKQYGELSRYPLLQLMRNGLSPSNCLDLLASLGIERSGDLLEQCWGRAPNGVNVNGYMTYADASSLAGRARTNSVYQLWPIMA